MTIEELEQYRGILGEIKAVEAEINSLYDVRRSPNGKQSSGSAGSRPSDPTGKAAIRIIELKEKLLTQQERWSDAAFSIETWLQSVDDLEIRAIVRWHYMLGLSWKRTSGKVYGKNDYYIARKRLYRFFGKE